MGQTRGQLCKKKYVTWKRNNKEGTMSVVGLQPGT